MSESNAATTALATGSVPQLRTAVEAMMAALDAGGDYLPAERVISAKSVLNKIAERMAISGNHTVVALAGATGSGKSTLFNAFVGALVSQVGRLRPTTTQTCAAVWGPESATTLLDWLDVEDRHHVAPGHSGRAGHVNLDGLVLLDLPDFDSYQRAHRAEVDRVLELADVFVWVSDPQKYADAVLHDDYLAKASDHTSASVVLLNQADRLTDLEQRLCREDLLGLLKRDGLDGVQVLLTSSHSGQGLEELGRVLADACAAKTASRERLLGDLHAHARALRAHVADTEPQVSQQASSELVAALARSAGVPIVLDAVERDHRRRALAATGWPLLRWVRHLKPDPLQRLRLQARKSPTEVTAPPEGFGELLARSSLPAASASARASVQLATRRLSSQAAAGLPRRWAHAIEAAVHPADADLADALDQAVMATPLRTRRPLWWSVVGVLQWIATLALVAGVAWLGVIGVISWLQLPQPELPRIGYVPVPTVLAAAGLALGLLLAFAARPLARVGARRARARTQRRLEAAITTVALERIVEPTRVILAAHQCTRESLDAAQKA